MNARAKLSIEVSFEDFNALDILVSQEVVRAANNLRAPDGALRPAQVAWLNRVRSMQENIARMRPPTYAEHIRAAFDSRRHLLPVGRFCQVL
jgi:hypothetical protein